jgi:hypothetical protein
LNESSRPANLAGCQGEKLAKFRDRLLSPLQWDELPLTLGHVSGKLELRDWQPDSGLTSDYDLTAPKELLHLRVAIPQWLEDLGNGLTELFRRLLGGLWHNLLAIDARVFELDQEINLIAQNDLVAVQAQHSRWRS